MLREINFGLKTIPILKIKILAKSPYDFLAGTLWVSLNENKKEDAENPLKSRQQFKTR